MHKLLVVICVISASFVSAMTHLQHQLLDACETGVCNLAYFSLAVDKVDPNFGDVNPLARAALHKRDDIVKLLLDYKAHPDFISGNMEKTALWSTVFFNNQKTNPDESVVSIVRVLLERGADVNYSVDGFSSLDMVNAPGYQCNEIKQLVLGDNNV